MEAADTDELHEQLIVEIRDLRTYVGNTSNLILDPVLDSYYLMDATLLKLPQGQDLLAQALLLGKERITSAKTPTVEERKEIIRLAALFCASIGRKPNEGWKWRFITIPRPT